MIQRIRWFHRYPKIALSLVVLLVIFAIDLTAGLIFIPPSPSELRCPHNNHHHDLKPNVEANTNWGPIRYRAFTNSLGFRSDRVEEVSLQPKESIRRILFMGDSFTEGLGVDYLHSFVGRLDNSLGPRGVEVLNAGVTGYSPKLYWLKTKYLIENVGLKFHELFVFIDVGDIPNELIFENYESGQSVAARAAALDLAKRCLFSAYILSRLREDRRNPFRNNGSGTPFSEDLDSDLLRDPDFYDPEGWSENYKYKQKGSQLASLHMKKLVDLCEQHEIKVTIVVYPWPVTVKLEHQDHTHVKYWKGFCDRNHLSFINLFPDFIDRYRMNPAACINLFIPGDIHWNSDGHKFVAERLAEYAFFQRDE